MMPESLFESLRQTPLETQSFVLAGGRKVEYGYGMARIAIEGKERPCPVIFGPEGHSLLGLLLLRLDTGDF